MGDKKVDVIIVGAGSAGVSAAITVASSGKSVLMVERGSYAGAKNVFGGAVYVQPTMELFPEFLNSAPIERFNTEHRYALLTKENGTIISYKDENDLKNSATVIRAKFDRWCVEQAKNAGAYFAPETLVQSLIVSQGKVIGIKTDKEDYYADIVIIADGVNSLLAKQLGLRTEIEPQHVALGVKEVIKLDKEKLEDRFNLTDTTGCIYMLIGHPMQNELGLGYIYTNKESVVVGVGISLADLKKNEQKPYEVLNELKKHPVVAPLISGGELIEYSAHLIPEAGYYKIPKLYTAGAMLVGDAAMLVNNIHWEGTNLAMRSGQLAGEVAVEAIANRDFSEQSLSLYQQKLQSSYIFKDLKTYKDVIKTLEPKIPEFFTYYPQKAAEFFEIFTTVDSKAKAPKFRKFLASIFTDRSIKTLLSDVWILLKTVIGVLKKQ